MEEWKSERMERRKNARTQKRKNARMEEWKRWDETRENECVQSVKIDFGLFVTLIKLVHEL